MTTLLTRRALAAGVAILAVGTAAQTTAAGAATTATTPIGSRFLKVVAAEIENSNHVVSQAQAVATAVSHDAIVASSRTYTAYVPAMKAANPRLKIYGYLNGMFAQDTEGAKYPASWYSRTPPATRSAPWGGATT